MTEEEAREQVRANTSVDAFARLEQLRAIVIAENARQNLISRVTVGTIWVRHILDSVQLIRWGRGADGLWLDVGTGGGFPGLAVAAVMARPVMLIEPRRRRADFLRRAVDELGLLHVEVAQAKVEAIKPVRAAVISARAVAPIEALLNSARHCADGETRWILPRGKSYGVEMHQLALRWQGVFHVEQSLSDPEAGIMIASGLERR